MIPPERGGDGPSIFMSFGRTDAVGKDACVKIADDIHASLDGDTMEAMSRGEWHASPGIGQGPWCSVARFGLEHLASVPTGSSSTLTIADDDTTWTIEVRDLLANDLAIGPLVQRGDGYEVDVEWTSTAGSISYVAASELARDNAPSSMSWSWWDEPNSGPSSVTVSGNTIALDAAAQIGGIFVEAERVGTADVCNGPAACGLDLNAKATRAF